MTKKRVTAADILTALIKSKEAHSKMINDDYDLGFNRGIEHSIYIIDQLLHDAWLASVQDARSKQHDMKLTRRKKNDI